MMGSIASSRPRVTVLLPVYNGAAYIAEAIESILAQTFRDFSLVIYEDGSTDDTLATIKRYDDPRIELRALAATGAVLRIWRTACNVRKATISPAWMPTTWPRPTASRSR
jgi:O-antigen biosynthesis protein